MTKAPTGTVTFLFTDIEGSTRLVRQYGDDYADILDASRRLLQKVFSEHGGTTVNTEGDASFIAFSRARDGVLGALAAQHALQAEAWPHGATVRIRMGIHTGEALATPDIGYVGLAVHHAARVAAAAHGGQVLVSEATRLMVLADLPSDAGLRDLGVFRLKDLAAPQRLYQLTHPTLAADFPRLRSLDAMPHNLPVQLTSFIGRDDAMAEVTNLLAANRLLTLTGSGGCGKTRLAQQFAAEIVEDFADGGWLIELAALAEAELVASATAAALGVREEPGRSLADTLADALQSRHLLLILDNCEHLVAACARLVEVLLRRCPRLQVLATSQEPLGVPGEVIFRVPSLELPDDASIAGLDDPDELQRYDGIQLFVDRAILARPGFALTSENAPAVAAICRRLDGIPLAIELAAARAGVLTPQQIANRLDDQFRLLAGNRSALPRHQTLRAAFEWSHALLSEPERTLLRRLSVFAGGWTLEAAETVTAGEGLDAFDVLDLLARLAQRSLVVVEEHEGEARYRLLETVRQYAHEKLYDAGETERVRTRHLEWYLDLVKRADPEFTGADQARWFRLVAAEYDNVRAALEWAAGHPSGGGALLALTASLWRFWLVRGHWSEGRSWLSRALETNGEAPTPTRARALAAAGDLATEQADYDAAQPLLEEALAVWRSLDEHEGVAKALNHLGNLARARSDHDAARSLLEEALTMRRSVGNERGMAVTLRNLAAVAALQRDYETARSLYDEALMRARRVGEKRVISTVTHALAGVLFDDGDRPVARTLATEGHDIARELGDQQTIADHLVVLAGLHHADGDRNTAVALLDEAIAIGKSLASRDVVAETHTKFGAMALTAGDHDAAMAHFDIAVDAWRALGDAPSVARLLNQRGWAAAMAGRLDDARRVLAEAESRAREIGDAAQLAATLHSRGEVARLAGDNDLARLLLDESRDLARSSSVRQLEWAPLFSLGALARSEGDLEEAHALLVASLAASPRTGWWTHVAETLDELAAVACDQGDGERAASLLGTAASLREERSCEPAPVRQSVGPRVAARARELIGDRAYDAAHAAGRRRRARDFVGPGASAP
jgi:predicted ATPase/class 3 adenylate cyclase